MQWGEWEEAMIKGGVSLTKVKTWKLSNLLKLSRILAQDWDNHCWLNIGKRETKIHQTGWNHQNQWIYLPRKVENLIDRVWTEGNGRPPNEHKKVIALKTFIMCNAHCAYDDISGDRGIYSIWPPRWLFINSNLLGSPGRIRCWHYHCHHHQHWYLAVQNSSIGLIVRPSVWPN